MRVGGLVVLIWLVIHFGIIGAAFAWLARVTFDLVVLTALAQWQYRHAAHVAPAALPGE